MTLLASKDDFTIGVASVDEEHEHIVGLISQLYDSIERKRTRTSILELLDKLTHATLEHFIYEERLMQETHYSGFLEHKWEHDKIKRKLQEFHSSISEDMPAEVLRELVLFLKCWIAVHILSCDKAIGPHLRTKGIT